MPFIRVNTIMICGWVIIVLLFKMSKMEMTTCLSRQYGILILFGISAFVYFLWIYCPYFNKLYRNSERNDNIGLPLASLGMALCMFTFAKEQYLYAFTLYIASTTVFVLLLYWDLYKIRQRKQKRKREKKNINAKKQNKLKNRAKLLHNKRKNIRLPEERKAV